MINDILNKYLNNERSVAIGNYTLEGITNLLKQLDNPHSDFRTIHIAGTNGKGSTAFMLSRILEQSGYKTGLYTSPHLLKINERIKINSHDIKDEHLYNYLYEIDNIASTKCNIAPTYFDMITAAAFKYFSDSSIDIAIIETGLGGRLDSTNVITPELSILTDISYDHMNILGKTISEISKEKCGIIKQGVPVITSNINTEIVSIITDYCINNNTNLYLFNRDFFTNDIRKEPDNFTFNYLSQNYILKDIKIPLFPVHQVKNTAVVITALNVLKSNGFQQISDNVIYSELEAIQVPGRFMKLNLSPLIIYDPAHNFDALSNLISGLEALYPDKKKLFIISMMKDKAVTETIELFNNYDVVYYYLDEERAFIPENEKFNLVVRDDNIIVEILQTADMIGDMIIFTGTFRIYSHVISIIQKFISKFSQVEK